MGKLIYFSPQKIMIFDSELKMRNIATTNEIVASDSELQFFRILIHCVIITVVI